MEWLVPLTIGVACVLWFFVLPKVQRLHDVYVVWKLLPRDAKWRTADKVLRILHIEGFSSTRNRVLDALKVLKMLERAENRCFWEDGTHSTDPMGEWRRLSNTSIVS